MERDVGVTAALRPIARVGEQIEQVRREDGIGSHSAKRSGGLCVERLRAALAQVLVERLPGALARCDRHTPRLVDPLAAPGSRIRPKASARSTATARYSAASAVRSSPCAPRGQSRRPTTTLIATPTATSSKRATPSCQPTGATRLKRTSTRTVKAA